MKEAARFAEAHYTSENSTLTESNAEGSGDECTVDLVLGQRSSISYSHMVIDEGNLDIHLCLGSVFLKSICFSVLYLASQLKLLDQFTSVAALQPLKMNNSTANATSISSAVISELIQEVYLDYVVILVDIVSIALLVYTMVLAIPQEMVYMWLSPKPFSIPNLLYAFTRYGCFIDQALAFWINLLPPGSLCNNIANVDNAAGILTYIGVQGLLITRAYSLCQGNKIVAGVLAFFFTGGFILNLYIAITSAGCSQSVIDPLVTLAQDVCSITTDLVVFCVCLWKVWDTWKSKHETGMGMRSGNDLVSVLLKQTIWRFCFVIVTTPALAIIVQFENSTGVNILSNLHHSISAILIADFTLDLRQRNSAAIRATDITLPTIQIQSVVNYIHQSILVEMGDDEIPIHGGAEGEDDLLMGSPDIEIRLEGST